MAPPPSTMLSMGLVARLVHQPSPGEPRVVLELAPPDPPRQGFEKLQLLRRGVQFQQVADPGLAMVGGQRFADERGIALRCPLPPAGVKAAPVAVVLAGDSVRCRCPAARPPAPRLPSGARLGRRPVRWGRPASVKATPPEHVPQATGIVAGINEVPQRVQRLGRCGCDARIGQQSFNGCVLHVVGQQFTPEADLSPQLPAAGSTAGWIRYRAVAVSGVRLSMYSYRPVSRSSQSERS